MPSLVARNIDIEYVAIKRKKKGQEKYSERTTSMVIEINILHKAKWISLGRFSFSNVHDILLEGNTTDQDKLKRLVDIKYKGNTPDRTLSNSSSMAFKSTIANTKLVAFGKTFEQASPYMMYYSDYS